MGGWWRRVAYEAFQNHKDELEPEKRGAGTWVDDEDLPSVGVKVSASSRDPATVKGVRHKKCPAKMLRERLHNRRNHLRKMEEDMALKTEVQHLAKTSDAAGWAKGEPFTCSQCQGVRRLEKNLRRRARAIDLYPKRTT